jgi:hypothetical protein
MHRLSLRKRHTSALQDLSLRRILTNAPTWRGRAGLARHSLRRRRLTARKADARRKKRRDGVGMGKRMESVRGGLEFVKPFTLTPFMLYRTVARA